MVKSFLKKIFPIKVLKNAFLIYNRVKAQTVDKFFFPEKRITKDDYLLYSETNPFLGNNVPVSHFSPKIRNLLDLWLDKTWTQDEYILQYKESGLLDPDYGWAMSLNHELVYPSLGFSRAPYVRKPDVFKTYLSKKKVVRLEGIISLRDTGEENYFHFYNDILPKLFLLKEQGINLFNYTIVVSEKLQQREYFKFIVNKTWLQDLTWHVQKNEWIQFDTAIFVKPKTHNKTYLDFYPRSVLKSPPMGQRRIFLTRDKRSLRFIENMSDLEPILKEYNFEIIETSTMPIASQIDLFSSCEYVIGIHGAGLTNIIFRNGAPLSLLEIVHPSAYIPFHYILLAHQYQYKYDILLGQQGATRYDGGFRVEPVDFRKKCDKMLTRAYSNNC